MMVIENKYEIGDIVYLLTDSEQAQRIIVAMIVYKTGEIIYKLNTGTVTSDHYDFELTDQKNVLA